MTKFQEFMNQYQLSQYRLHKMTGFTKSQVSEWQHGKHRPSLKSAYRIAIALHLSIQTVKSQLELRECGQNAISPDGLFVPRTKKSSRTNSETNDTGRTDATYCLTCHQRISKAA